MIAAIIGKRRDNNTMNRSAGVVRLWNGQFNPGTRLSLPLSRLDASNMKLSEFTFERGTISHIRAIDKDVLESAYRHFGDVNQLHPTKLKIAEVACHPRSGWNPTVGNQTVGAWLSSDADIPLECAVDIINSFPMPIAPRLNQIAMNPCRFLGLASSISRRPDTIVFSTGGMDPRGVKNIHKYALKHFQGCLIHLDISKCTDCVLHGSTYQIDDQLTVIAG